MLRRWKKRRLYVFVGSICAVLFLPSTLAFVAIADGCRRHVIYTAIPYFHIVSVKYLVHDVWSRKVLVNEAEERTFVWTSAQYGGLNQMMFLAPFLRFGGGWDSEVVLGLCVFDTEVVLGLCVFDREVVLGLTTYFSRQPSLQPRSIMTRAFFREKALGAMLPFLLHVHCI